MRFFTIIALSLSMLAGHAGIAGADAWTDQAELSLVDTGGNTETTTLSAKNVLKGPLSARTDLTWSLSGLFAETDGATTAEQYITELRLDYNFSDRLYTFGLGGWKQDEPAGLESRERLGLGVGYHLLTGPAHELSGEAGLDLVSEEFTDGSDDDYNSARLFAGYGWNISENSKFTQTLEYLPDLDDSDNYQTNTETAYISTVNQTLSLKTSYDVQYDSDPAAGFEKTDTRLGVTLVFNLK